MKMTKKEKEFAAKSKLIRKVYEAYGDNFETGFHDLLWQIHINGTYNALEHTPYPSNHVSAEIRGLVGPGEMLVMASAKGGYVPTFCVLKESVSHEDALKLAEKIAKAALNQSKDEHNLILKQSFWGSKGGRR